MTSYLVFHIQCFLSWVERSAGHTHITGHPAGKGRCCILGSLCIQLRFSSVAADNQRISYKRRPRVVSERLLLELRFSSRADTDTVVFLLERLLPARRCCGMAAAIGVVQPGGSLREL